MATSESAAARTLEQTSPSTILAILPEREVLALGALQDFEITSDSVVATATIRTDKQMRRIVVDWGDGSRDTIKMRPFEIPQDNHANLGPDPLPAGTYQVRHRFEEPENRSPFDTLVTLQVDGTNGTDFSARLITLTPRYTVTVYSAYVAATGPCEPGWKGSVTFEVTQTIDGEAINQWQWTTSNNFFTEVGGFRLEGSAFRREMIITDPYIVVGFRFLDRDDFGFDDELYLSFWLSAREDDQTIRRHQETDSIWPTTCGVRLSLDVAIDLIARMPANNEPAFSFE